MAQLATLRHRHMDAFQFAAAQRSRKSPDIKSFATIRQPSRLHQSIVIDKSSGDAMMVHMEPGENVVVAQSKSSTYSSQLLGCRESIVTPNRPGEQHVLKCRPT